MNDILERPASKGFWVSISIIAAVSLAVYANVLGNGLVFDDDFLVLNNPWITDARFIPKIFLSGAWEFKGDVTSFYRPLMHVTYMLTYYLFGLGPWAFHVVNVLFHAGSSVMVFLIARKLLAASGSRQGILSPPLMAAVLFAVHPVHTEAVAWVAGLTDLSYTFFCLLSLYLYIRSDGRYNTPYYLSALAFLTGMLFKEPAAALPLLLLAYDLLLRGEKPRMPSILKRYAPFALAVIVYAVLRFLALGGSMAPARRAGGYGFIGNMFVLIAAYVNKLILPFDLKLIHSFSPVGSLFEPYAAAAAAITALVVLLYVIAYRKNRTAFFFLLVIALPMLPCLYTPAILAGNISPMGERYLYLPSAGFAMLIGLPMARLFRQGKSAVAVSSFLALAVLFSALTISRNADWKDGYTLWSAELSKSPNNSFVHGSLGKVYYRDGRYDLALDEFITAVNCKPVALGAYNDLGRVYNQLGMVDKSIEALNYSLKLDPEDADAHNDLGVDYIAKGDLNNGLEHFQAAVRLDPANPGFRQNLEQALKQTRK
jgi:tetratricopeptide (TPR) repeat protein